MLGVGERVSGNGVGGEEGMHLGYQAHVAMAITRSSFTPTTPFHELHP